MLVREEVLLAGLCKKNTVPAENLRSFTTSHGQTNMLQISFFSLKKQKKSRRCLLER